MSKPIDYSYVNNAMAIYAGSTYPLHAHVIAQICGLSVSQVYYRLRKNNISLRDIRNGVAGVGKEAVRELTVKTCSLEIRKQCVKYAKEVINARENHKKVSA